MMHVKKDWFFQNYYWQLQILLKMDIGAYMYVLRKHLSEVINFYKKITIGSCDIYCANKLVRSVLTDLQTRFC